MILALLLALDRLEEGLRNAGQSGLPTARMPRN